MTGSGAATPDTPVVASSRNPLKEIPDPVRITDVRQLPGRYVGVAPEEQDEDFDFEETLRAIHIDLKGLNEEAAELGARIARNFEELGA